MANMVNGARLVRALMNLIVSDQGYQVLKDYGKYTRFGSASDETHFAKSLMKFNSLSHEKGFGYFITKAVQSDDEVKQLAREAFDVMNDMSSMACVDSYTQEKAQ